MHTRTTRHILEKVSWEKVVVVVVQLFSEQIRAFYVLRSTYYVILSSYCKHRASYKLFKTNYNYLEN